MLVKLHYRMYKLGWLATGVYSWQRGSASANLITGGATSKIPELVAFHHGASAVYVLWWKLGNAKVYPTQPWNWQ